VDSLQWVSVGSTGSRHKLPTKADLTFGFFEILLQFGAWIFGSKKDYSKGNGFCDEINSMVREGFPKGAS
jgi:hypothetical protein